MNQTQKLTELDFRYIDGKLYKVCSDFKIYTKVVDAVITVPAGEITDLASIPWWLVITRAFVREKISPAAVVHDHIYKTHIYDRSTADKIFLDLMDVLCDTFKITNRTVYSAVRVGGHFAYKNGRDFLKENNPEIYKNYYKD